MKKIKIFSLLSILLAVFSLTSIIGRAEGAVLPSSYSNSSGTTRVDTGDSVVYIDDIKHADMLTIKFGDGHTVVEDADTFNIKGHVVEIYRLKVTVRYSDSSKKEISALFDSTGGYTGPIELGTDGYFEFHGKLDADWAGKTITEISFQCYTTNKTENRIGELQILGAAFDADGEYADFASLYDPNSETLFEGYTVEHSGFEVVDNVYTMTGTSGTLTMSFKALKTGYKYASLKYLMSDTISFETYANVVSSDSQLNGLQIVCGGINNSAHTWNSKGQVFDEYNVSTITIGEYFDDYSVVSFDKVCFSFSGVAGDSITFLDFNVTKDGEHEFADVESGDYDASSLTWSTTGVYTLTGSNDSIVLNFNNVSKDYKYVSIKYKMDEGVDFDTYAYMSTKSAFEKWVQTSGLTANAWNGEIAEVGDYKVITLDISSFFGINIVYNSLKINISGEAGKTVEINNVIFTKDGNHGFVELTAEDYDATKLTWSSEGATLSEGVYTLTGQNDAIIANFNNITNDHSYISIKLNKSAGVDFEVYTNIRSVSGAETYEYSCASSSAWNVTAVEFSDYVIYTIAVSSYVSKGISYNKVKFTLSGAAGSTVEVLEFNVTKDGVHGFEIPQGFQINGPVGSGLKVTEGEDGAYNISYSNAQSSWRSASYSFINYDKEFDAIKLVIYLTEKTNLGIRVNYKENGESKYIEPRNHYQPEGVAEKTGEYTIEFLLDAFGVAGKDIEGITLYFDNPTSMTTNTGDVTAIIKSLELVKSSTLELTDPVLTLNDTVVKYTEKTPLLDIQHSEDISIRYEYARVVEGEELEWNPGLPTTVGEYVVKANFIGSLKYNHKSVEAKLTIQKADQAISADAISIDQETGVITIAEGVEASFTEDFAGERIANGDVIPFDVNVFFRIPGNSNYNVSDVLIKPFSRTLEQQIAYEVELIEEKIAGYEEDSRIQKLVNPLIEKIKGAQDKSDIEIYLEDFDDDALTSLKETIDAERALTKAQNEAKSSIAALILGYEEEDSIKSIVNPVIAKIDAATTPAEVEAAVAELNVEVLNEAIEVVIAARNLKNEKDSQIEFITDYVGEFASQINVQAYIDRINQATSIDEVQEIADEACDFIDDQKDIIALQPTKDDAIEELEAIDLTVYRDAEKAVVEGHINDAKTAINAATTLAGVESALETAKTAIALVKTDANLDAEELDAAKNAAYDDIDEAADPSDYQTEEQTALVNIINKAKADINEATTIAQVESLLNAALEDIDALWTIQDYIDKAAKDLADAKTAAKAELDTYLDKANYREAQHADIDAAIAAGKAAIDGAGSTDVVTSAMNDAKAALDAIKTDAELDAEEAEAAAQALAAAKEAAIAAVIAEIGSYNIDKTAYVNAINAATSTDTVQTALTNAKSDIATKKAAIDEANKPAPQPTPEPQPQPTPEPSKKGCKGSLVASIFGMVALLGACLTFKRKKD